MTILLTVSPKEAVELLNGNATSLVRSWKVPLGTAYIAVKKARTIKEWLVRCLDDVWRTIGNALGWTFLSTTLHFDGKIVAKCVVETYEEIFTNEDGLVAKSILNQSCLTQDDIDNYWGDVYKPLYALHLTALTVFDKPMEVGQFKPIKKAKYDGFAWEITNAKNGMIAMDDGMYNIGDPITRLPSRWQEVEVRE